MVARTFTGLILILCFALFSDTRSNIAAPSVEKLYIVDSDQNQPDATPGNGICDTALNHCTLKAAIQEANRDNSPSKIMFASMMTISSTPGEALIEPHTTIDASDQWDGGWPNNGQPGVIIVDGGEVGGILVINGDYAKVYGINFQGSGSTGIAISGSYGSNIGGLEPGQRNVFTMPFAPSDISIGIEIKNGATKNDIRGNYFGTFDGEKIIPSLGEYGIFVYSHENLVRENLIVGHSDVGINIWGNHNLIQENIIGTNKSKNKALPNGIGITVYLADENQIGPDNKIYYNDQEGILLQGSAENIISGNNIVSNGSHGITISGSDDNLIGILGGNGISHNGGNGIHIDHGNNNQVRLNYFSENGLAGIYLQHAQNNSIGGVSENHFNTIRKNGTHGVHLDIGALNNSVSGNFIGIRRYGDLDNGNLEHGVLIENGASGNRIGGLEPGKGNWIGWNDHMGIYITGSGSTGNTIEGNVIGGGSYWSWETPNGQHGIGIYDGASGNWIGWFNTIVANGWSGLAIVNSSNNIVWFNNIGTDGADIKWGNKFYGIHIVNSPGNQILSNRIHNNGNHAGEAGVKIDGSGSTNNFISLNSVHNNGGLGIELVNDGNSNQPSPTISSGSCDTGISGTACPGCIIEIFSDTVDEGLFFEASVNADPSTGAFSWTGSPAGPNLTATASSAILGSTSQFSTAYNIGTCHNPPIAAFTYYPVQVYSCTLVTFDGSSSSDVEDLVSALQVRWDWENDGTFDTDLSTQKTAQHKFNSSGVKTVRLEVQDTDGMTDSATSVIDVGACSDLFLPLVMR